MSIPVCISSTQPLLAPHHSETSPQMPNANIHTDKINQDLLTKTQEEMHKHKNKLNQLMNRIVCVTKGKFRQTQLVAYHVYIYVHTERSASRYSNTTGSMLTQIGKSSQHEQ